MAGRSFALFGVAVIVAACVAAGSPSPTGIAHPTGPNELVLRIESGGGLVAPGFLVGQIPMLSIYGDGRVVVPGAQIDIYPGPALPSVVAYRISEEGIQKILENAQAAGLLGPDAHYDDPFVADLPTTTFTVYAGGGKHVISAYGLAEATGNDAQLDPDVRRARAALYQFEQKVGDVRGFLGPTVVVEPEAQYQPTTMRIYVTAAVPDQSGGLQPNFQDWPLTTPLAEFGAPTSPSNGQLNTGGMRCGTVTGDDLKTLMPKLQVSNQLTFWRSGAETYQLILRPLLPDESGCPAPTA
jgi:hypothetical protein